MIAPTRFWKQVEAHRGRGILVLGLLTSWKPTADLIGRDAVDVASGMFDVVCNLAFSSADARARLSTTVIGAYWADEQDVSAVVAWLDRWVPLVISSGENTFQVNIRTLSLERTAKESGRELYRKAQSELATLVGSLPKSEQYPAMDASWEDAAG